MDNDELQAIQTFSAVPEVYQQIFKDAGADFPDELVAAIKESPEQAEKILNSDKSLKDGVISIFKSNKNRILSALQGMFKKGGKLEQGLLKFATGGQNEAFSVLPERVYNEKGAELMPGTTLNTKLDYIFSRREPRQFKITLPTTLGQIHNVTNQSRMLWNPRQLSEPYEYIGSYTTDYDPEHYGEFLSIFRPSDFGKVRQRSKGGTIAEKENAIHEKYDNILKKSGEDSVKEMERISRNKKFELKKIK